MGFQHILKALKIPKGFISQKARILLYALCSHANEKNTCYPGNALLFQEAELGRTSFFNALSELKDAKLIDYKLVQGHAYQNAYLICVDNFPQSSEIRTIENQSFNIRTIEKSQSFRIRTPIVQDVNSNRSDPERNRIRKEKISKSVSMYPAQQDLFPENVDNSPKDTAVQTSSAEELLVQPEPKRTEKAPSAPAMMQEANQKKPDYKTLVKTYGWKPTTKEDIVACWSLVFQLGANREEADRFIRRNSARKWNGVGQTCSVKMLAHLWIDAWKKKDFDGWCDERKRRYEEKRRAEEERIRKLNGGN